MYVPAICSVATWTAYATNRDSTGNSSTEGGFGCREWGCYLQSPSAPPYIDITSYQNKVLTFVRLSAGDGLTFPKPVIGKVLDTWLCLYDRPDNEAPGVIPDISVWAKAQLAGSCRQSGLPMFVDKARKVGEFVD